MYQNIHLLIIVPKRKALKEVLKNEIERIGRV